MAVGSFIMTKIGPYVMGLHFTGPHNIKPQYIFKPIISPIFNNEGPYVMGLHLTGQQKKKALCNGLAFHREAKIKTRNIFSGPL